LTTDDVAEKQVYIFFKLDFHSRFTIGPSSKSQTRLPEMFILQGKDDNSEPSGLAKYCSYDRVDLNAGDVISSENIVGKIVLLPSLGKVFRLVLRSIVGTELKFL
jgi:hypothetical protein